MKGVDRRDKEDRERMCGDADASSLTRSHKIAFVRSNGGPVATKPLIEIEEEQVYHSKS